MTDRAEREFYGFEVDLESFSGPLDLLLSLIRKDEVDIFDIPIARITDQYLSVLEGMRAQSIEVTGEFLVMAATLMQIKSRMLLPKPPPQPGAAAEEEVDPRQELVNLLLEYERYRAAAEVLGDLSLAQQRVFAAPGEELVGLMPDLEEVTLTALLRAYTKALEATRVPPPPPLRPPRYAVREQADLIVARLALGPCDFAGLLSGRPTRLEVVVTFMALLELIRDQRVRAVQEGLGDEIRLERVPHDA